MLDKPPGKADWERKASSLAIDGRAVIDGRSVDAVGGRTFAKHSPIDGRKIAEVADGEAVDIDRAVAAARASFEDGRWRDLPPADRKRIMLRFAELIRGDLETLALLETLDVGKVIGNSLAVDVPNCAACIQYYAEFADKLVDEIAPTGPSDVALIRREPLGVIGAVVPWNYPLIITGWKIGPALVAGNSVVLKPAEQSPLSAIRLAKLALEAGIPPGVFNVVPGFGEKAGKPLALHPDVDMVSFTGSTEVGKLMLRYAGESNMKRIALECGGKTPHVVMADADLDAAASGIAWGLYYNQGETCHAGSPLLVHPSVKDALIEKISEVQKRDIPLGHPLDPASQMGALIEKSHMERVLSYIGIGQSEGARVAVGGRRTMEETGGYYVEATILDGVKPEHRVARDEIFGPVLAVTTVETEAEMIRLANGTIYGLGAAVWTEDRRAGHRMTRAIKAGTVWLNCFDRSTMATPFGGFKQSGHGRDRSPHAIDKYTDLKTVWAAYD